MLDTLKQLKKKQQLEYFTAQLVPNTKYTPISGNTRLEQWQAFCKRHYLQANHVSMMKLGDGPETIELRLTNGLSIVDKGENLVFSATKSKEDIKLRTVLPIIYNVGSYLMRRGWYNGTVEIPTNRSGSNEMIEIFQQSMQDTQQKLNKELLEKLSCKKSL